MSASALVHSTWESLSGGDMAAVSAPLAPDARWRAVEDGPWNCDSRNQILEVMGERLRRGLDGEIVSVEEVGKRAIVGFRPHDPDPGPWPLDEGVRYIVLTLRDNLITEMKGCATRSDAQAYAAAGPVDPPTG